jgi:L-ascorbate metabolism protein UlaG (beta-lactamase superfamily)
MLDASIRRRAKSFTKLIRRSALTPRTGSIGKPVLARRGELGLTFIGHSSFFVQIGGQNVIIDPNFARWLFVLKRLRRPGVRIKDLPPMDVVLVTHAHFDHLHRPSLRAIARHTRQQSDRAPVIMVPRNVSDLISDLGFREIIELDMWEPWNHDGVQVTLVPARHWGARVVRDIHRGFGGYVLRSQRDSLYHAGDTAYFSGFREIGERLGPELALLPIGAYDPFRAVHASPEDAVRAFLDLGSRWMVPMHYGTFRLSHEPMDEPLRLLAQEAETNGVQDRVLVLPEGVTHFFRRERVSMAS